MVRAAPPRCGRGVVQALGLDELAVPDRAALAHRAVDGRDEVVLAALERTRPGAKLPGEEGVERRVCVGIRLQRFVHVDHRVGVQHGSGHRATKRGLRAAGEAVHEARQRVLRQEILQQREGTVGRAGLLESRLAAHRLPPA
jgi:hypothetical protein